MNYNLFFGLVSYLRLKNQRIAHQHDNPARVIDRYLLITVLWGV